jgi:hypothetical protein
MFSLIFRDLSAFIVSGILWFSFVSSFRFCMPIFGKRDKRIILLTVQLRGGLFIRQILPDLTRSAIHDMMLPSKRLHIVRTQTA